MGRQPPPEIIAAARQAHSQWPTIPASVMLAQWALESGWGAHMPAGSNNPFGEKALPGQMSVAAPTTEIIAGRVVPTNAPFRGFPSIAEAFSSHAEHLATSRYFIAARACLPDLKGFCDALGGGTAAKPSYSTNPNYGAELMAIIQGSDLTAYDSPGATA